MSEQEREPAKHDPGAETHAQQVNAAMDRPDTWMSLDPDVVTLVAYWKLRRYGESDTQSPAASAEIEHLYSALMLRLQSSDRLWLAQQLCVHAKRGDINANPLLPFILGDTDKRVISSTAIDYAMLLPRIKDDPLTGPKSLLGLYDQAVGLEHTRMGILTGLILLGDERLLPMVKGRWRDFQSQDDRRELAAACSGHTTTLLTEFLLDWLENTNDESDIGAIAGAMARMPDDDKVGGVMRVSRCFPAAAAEPGMEVDCLDVWTFAEFADLIEPRLIPLIAKESFPQVIPQILEFWRREE